MTKAKKQQRFTFKKLNHMHTKEITCYSIITWLLMHVESLKKCRIVSAEPVGGEQLVLGYYVMAGVRFEPNTFWLHGKNPATTPPHPFTIDKLSNCRSMWHAENQILLGVLRCRLFYDRFCNETSNRTRDLCGFHFRDVNFLDRSETNLAISLPPPSRLFGGIDW